MKPAPFRYSRPETLDEAVGVLAEFGDEARPLAGGQSLLPMMNFRLARPAVLVDLARVPGLDSISVSDRGLTIGAMARQADVAASGVVAELTPLVCEGLRHVGHHQIRTRGTIGGSLAHGDPAAELPAIALLLDAELEAYGPRGPRTIPAAAFWRGPYTTDLADDEVLTSVHLRWPPGAVWSFKELARRGGDFAIAGVAALRHEDNVRLVAFGLGWVPMRLEATEAALQAGGADAIGAAAAAAHDEVEPTSDVHGDAGYRRDVAATLVRQVVGELTP